ncbi:MAG: glutamine--scyllo-inositol aminotransferase [Cyclobacteriaceae bacterium]|nr:MAG: glutamine--scyllo-inositol aminotransferase [Cyclobacteriaceae bacterium]
MQIPFFDLTRQLQNYNELYAAIQQVMQSGQFAGGEWVREFEKNFAAKLRLPFCIGTANGTDALYLIFKALQLPAGTEVVTPAWSCMPTAETISMAGYKPVFCDIDPEYMVLTAETVAQKITSRTRAVLAVHLYGQAAPVADLRQFCEAHNLYLIEDCAQAHLTLEKGKPVGTFGMAAAFSFYPTKNLGALGDAGCVVTANEQLAQRIRTLANHGSPPPEQYNYQTEGLNSRLDALQAAVLNTKLKRLDEFNNRRTHIALLYNKLLKDVADIKLPSARPEVQHTWHIYPIRTRYRDELKNHLQQNGIETRIHYPVALPLSQAYRHCSFSEYDFPVAACLAREVLSLPVFPELTEEEAEYVAGKVIGYFRQQR